MSDVKFLQTELEKHVKECQERFRRIDERIDRLIDSQERCTVALEQLAKDTHGVVELYKNAQGAMTLGVNIQRFGLWLIKWPLIGAGIYAMYKWTIEHLEKIT